MMTETIFFDTLRQGLWVAVIISVPILTVALVAGLTIGLFQALTSIQEMTLTDMCWVADLSSEIETLEKLHVRQVLQGFLADLD